jgi:hypothetical protein
MTKKEKTKMTLAEVFETYIEFCYGRSSDKMSQPQLRDIKRAFFAGAATVFSIVGTLDEETGPVEIASLIEEINLFKECVREGLS